MRILSCVLLLACGDAVERDVRVDTTPQQAPPPQIGLSYTGVFEWGDTVVLNVEGAEAGETIYLARGSDTGPGPCPPQLNGACLDVQGPVSLLTVLVADGSGAASHSMTLPPGAGTTVAALQAVVIRAGAPALLSNTIWRRVDSTTPFYVGPTYLETARVWCPDADTFRYRATTTGWVYPVRVNAWDTGAAFGWDEEMELPNIDFDPMGWWDETELSLPDDTAVQDYYLSQNTVFSCGVHDVDPVMTYMFRAYDATGALADCWIFGTDPTGVQDVRNGVYPSNNTMTDPGDIAGCTEI